MILDYWMADMDGLDVAAELKSISRKTPIIMFSGFASILDEALGKVDLWLRKGESDPEQLLMAVVHLLSRNRPPSVGSAHGKSLPEKIEARLKAGDETPDRRNQNAGGRRLWHQRRNAQQIWPRRTLRGIVNGEKYHFGVRGDPPDFVSRLHAVHFGHADIE